MNASTGKRVLIVGHGRDRDRELHSGLVGDGLRCESSDGCAAARDLLAAEAIDLVVVDLDLPEHDVESVAETAAGRGTVLVCRSEGFDESSARQAMRLGARELLDSERPAQCVERVRAVLGFGSEQRDVARELQRVRSQYSALERRFLEQMLAVEESQETFYLDLSRMMTIISNIMDGILFADCDGNITLMNPVAEDLLGIKSFMAIGRPVTELPAVGDLIDAIREDFESLSTRNEITRTVEAHHSEQDLLYIKVHTSRVTDYRDCSAGILCVLQDVTAEYKTDQLKNQYLSIVAHELRTPLTGIKTFSTMMSKGSLGDLTEQQQRVVESIREQSLRLEQQIDKLINLGNLESEEYQQDVETFDISDFIVYTLAPLEPVAEDRGIEFSIRGFDQGIEVEGDRADLRRALQAIVENAIKFTPDGGTVEVEVTRADDGALFSIRDSGAGIDPRYQRRIFEKFFQVEDPLTRHHGGAGLGLFFARGIVEAHGSELSVESELGQGAHFSFVLPYADREESEHVGVANSVTSGLR